MKTRILRRLAATAIALGVIALGAVSCSDSPMQSRGHVAELASPMAQLAAIGQTFQDDTPGELAGIDIDGAYAEAMLARPSGAKSNLISFAETNEDEVDFSTRRWLVKSQEISAKDGGTIVFGTKKVGYSTLEIPADALDEDEVITIVHKLKGKRDLFLFPHGTEFNASVTVRFSLEGLSNRQLRNLLNMRLYYHDPDPDGNPDTDDGGWQLIPSYSDGSYVVATLEHFLRYAVGSDR